MKNKYLLGILFCLTAVLSWGGMFPVMGTAMKVVNPFIFTLIRYTSAAVLFLLLLYVKEGRKAFAFEGRSLQIWLLGSSGFAGFGFLVFLGQKLSGPSGALSASVMMALMPLLSVVVNWLFRGIKPLKYSLAFVLMSFFGVLTVVTKGDYATLARLRSDVLADGCILLGALCWVVYTIGAAYFPKWSPVRYTALTTCLGVLTIWAVNLALWISGYQRVPSLADCQSILPQILYMVLIAGFVGVLAWNAGNKILTSLNGVLFMDVVPITTFAIAAFQGYLFNRAEMIGAGLTVSALIFNNIYQRVATQAAVVAPEFRKQSFALSPGAKNF